MHATVWVSVHSHARMQCVDILTLFRSVSLSLSLWVSLSYNCVLVRVRRYGVVPKGLLAFFGSLYTEGVKTTSGTLVCHFERLTARKNISSFQKHCVFNLECRILSREHDTISKQTKKEPKNTWRHWLSWKQPQTFLWLLQLSELRKSLAGTKLHIAWKSKES